MDILEMITPHGDDDAINLIKKDHDKVKDLFKKFQDAKTLQEKKKIAQETILELKLHAIVEEDIFYTRVRPEIEKMIMNEADEEHHVMKLLVAELENMDGTEDHYEAKYKVLSENVRHHIREEESDMLPKARGLDVDYNKMGQEILNRKEELKKNGIPEFAEEKLISGKPQAYDSPAKAARKSPAHAKTKNTAKKISSGKKASLAKTQKTSKVIKLTKANKKTAGKLKSATKPLHNKKKTVRK